MPSLACYGAQHGVPFVQLLSPHSHFFDRSIVESCFDSELRSPFFFFFYLFFPFITVPPKEFFFVRRTTPHPRFCFFFPPPGGMLNLAFRFFDFFTIFSLPELHEPFSCDFLSPSSYGLKFPSQRLPPFLPTKRHVMAPPPRVTFWVSNPLFTWQPLPGNLSFGPLSHPFFLLHILFPVLNLLRRLGLFPCGSSFSPFAPFVFFTHPPLPL